MVKSKQEVSEESVEKGSGQNFSKHNSELSSTQTTLNQAIKSKASLQQQNQKQSSKLKLRRQTRSPPLSSVFEHIPPTPPTNANTPSSAMSKLSPSLKQLINAPFAKPNYTVPSTALRPLLARLVDSAKSHSISTPAWLTFQKIRKKTSRPRKM